MICRHPNNSYLLVIAVHSRRDVMSRLPIFRDDLSFHDRNRRAFDDMRHPFTSTGSATWDDELDRMCRDFYQLRPSSDPLRRLRTSGGEMGSRESLDESAVRSMMIEDPQTKSRRFEMSFDVKDYDPKEISVKVGLYFRFTPNHVSE